PLVGYKTSFMQTEFAVNQTHRFAGIFCRQDNTDPDITGGYHVYRNAPDLKSFENAGDDFGAAGQSSSHHRYPGHIRVYRGARITQCHTVRFYNRLDSTERSLLY